MRNSMNTDFEEVTKMAFELLDDGDVIDTGYGFMSNKGIEVCSDSELE